jgi:hypothetical protein
MTNPLETAEGPGHSEAAQESRRLIEMEKLIEACLYLLEYCL